MEDDPFCLGGETFVEDYLNYEGSDDILYDFGPSGGGDVLPLETKEEDVEILKTSTVIEQVVEVATIVTSAPQGNDHKILFSIFLSRIVSDFDCFVKTSMAAAPSVVAPLLVDPSGLDYLYQGSLVQNLTGF